MHVSEQPCGWFPSSDDRECLALDVEQHVEVAAVTVLDGQVDGVAELACPHRVGRVGADPGEPTERHAHEEVVADFSAEVDALQQELPRAFAGLAP